MHYTCLTVCVCICTYKMLLPQNQKYFFSKTEQFPFIFISVFDSEGLVISYIFLNSSILETGSRLTEILDKYDSVNYEYNIFLNDEKN